MKWIGVRLVGIGRAVAEHDYVTALFHRVDQSAEIHGAQDLDVRDHSHLLVRSAIDWAVQLVRTGRQGESKGAGRADLDRLEILFESLSFDFERVQHRPAIRHGKRHFASGNSQP